MWTFSPPHPQELGNSPQDLLKLLLYHSNRSATDPRDKIYALLGLLCEPPNLKVDYCSSVAQVYTDVARCIMGSSGKLDVLTAIERRSSAFRNHKRQQTRPHNLPTWVPDSELSPSFGLLREACKHRLLRSSMRHRASVSPRPATRMPFSRVL